MADKDEKSVADMAAEVKAAFERKLDEVKARAEEAIGRAEKGESLTAAQKQATDEALTAFNEMKARMDDLEQKHARPGGEPDAGRTIGDRFTTSEDFKSFAASQRRGDSASIEFKADITTGTGAGGMGPAIHARHLPGIQMLPDRGLTVRDLLAPGQTDSPVISYDQETGFSNNAAMVAEGDLKPQSDISIREVTTSTKVIAHWVRMTKQVLSDVPQLRSLIDGRLRFGLDIKEESQLLNGDGTGENLNGLIPQATAFAPAFAAPAAQMMDGLRLAMLQAALAEYPASGHVLHPADWARIEMLKDGDGNYIIGNPQGTVSPTMWGLPVVATQAMQQDKFLTGAFRMAAQIFDQWAVRIETGFQNDDFVRNKVTVLAEKRLALAVYRPEALIYGDFGNIT